VYEHPLQASRDQSIRTELQTRGYRVILIRHDEPLPAQVAKYPEVFGRGYAVKYVTLGHLRWTSCLRRGLYLSDTPLNLP